MPENGATFSHIFDDDEKRGFKIFFHFLSPRKKNLDLLEKEETPIAFLQHSEK